MLLVHHLEEVHSLDAKSTKPEPKTNPDAPRYGTQN